MRRENRRAIHVTYAELSAQPIQLMIHECTDGGIIVELPGPELALTEAEIEALQAEACKAGKPVNHEFERTRRMD
jgi:hypothetical protein